MRAPRRASSRSTAPVAGVAVLLLALCGSLVQPPAALADPGGRDRARHGSTEPTVPTRLEEEMATNPFLRAPDVAALAAMRKAKDEFR